MIYFCHLISLLCYLHYHLQMVKLIAVIVALDVCRLRELSPKRKGLPGDGAASQGGRGRRAGRSRSSSPSLLDHDTAASQRRKQPLTKEEVGILAKCRADFLAKQNEELNKVIAPSAEVMGGADEQAAPYAAPSAADGDAASSTCPVRAGSRDSERREPTANEVAQGSTPPRSDAVAMRQGLQVGRTSYPVDHRLSAHGQKSDEQFSRYMSAQRTGLQNLSSSNNSISRSYSSMQPTEKQALAAIDAIEQLEAGRSLSPSARRAAGAQRWIPPNTAQLQQRRLSPQTLKLQQRQQQQQGRPTSAAAPDADREAPRTAHGSRSSVVTSTTSTTTQEYTAH